MIAPKMNMIPFIFSFRILNNIKKHDNIRSKYIYRVKYCIVTHIVYSNKIINLI